MTRNHSTAEVETAFKACKFQCREFGGIQPMRKQSADYFLEELFHTIERPDKRLVL